MSIVEGLVVIVIIILIIYFMKQDKEGACGSCNTCPKPVTPVAPGSASPKQKKYEDLANEALAEQTEYFRTCRDASEENRMLDCVCGDSEKFSFAENEYGAPGLDYNGFVASQAVDDQVIKNHSQFVKDRKGFGPVGEWTGRTYSPDSHDSYDPIPWIGLRRPAYVEQCNPTQVSQYKAQNAFISLINIVPENWIMWATTSVVIAMLVPGLASL